MQEFKLNLTEQEIEELRDGKPIVFNFANRGNGLPHIRITVFSEEECEYCGGSGEVSTNSIDSSGNIERGTGSEVCVCMIKEPEYDNQQ